MLLVDQLTLKLYKNPQEKYNKHTEKQIVRSHVDEGWTRHHICWFYGVIWTEKSQFNHKTSVRVKAKSTL